MLDKDKGEDEPSINKTSRSIQWLIYLGWYNESREFVTILLLEIITQSSGKRAQRYASCASRFTHTRKGAKIISRAVLLHKSIKIEQRLKKTTPRYRCSRVAKLFPA